MRFNLIKLPNGVTLRAVTENGDVYNLLTFFKNNGHIVRSHGIPSNIGLQVDDHGRLLIAEGGG